MRERNVLPRFRTIFFFFIPNESMIIYPTQSVYCCRYNIICGSERVEREFSRTDKNINCASKKSVFCAVTTERRVIRTRTFLFSLLVRGQGVASARRRGKKSGRLRIEKGRRKGHHVYMTCVSTRRRESIDRRRRHFCALATPSYGKIKKIIKTL